MKVMRSENESPSLADSPTLSLSLGSIRDSIRRVFAAEIFIERGERGPLNTPVALTNQHHLTLFNTPKVSDP